MRRRLGSGVVLAFVACVVASCALVEGEAAKAKPGEPCTKNEDCESKDCRSEGFCGVNDCRGDPDCPAGWTCRTTKGDPIFGIGGGKKYCEPTCAACPAGMACERGASCEPLVPRITVGGDVPRVGRPVNLELTIDSRGRPFTSVGWSFVERSNGATPSPRSGTGTRLTGVTFPETGPWRLDVLLDEPGGRQNGGSVEIVACAGTGEQCSGDGACCEGECALKRWNADVSQQEVYCVDRCPASCAPGYSCRAFDRFHDSSLPTGDFCLPDAPRVTLTASPSTPTIADEVTFTATATSPANLRILAYEWFVGSGSYPGAKGATMTRKLDRAGDYEIRVQVRDDAGQTGQAEMTIRSCIPAGGTCSQGEPCCGGMACTSGKCQ